MSNPKTNALVVFKCFLAKFGNFYSAFALGSADLIFVALFIKFVGDITIFMHNIHMIISEQSVA